MATSEVPSSVLHQDTFNIELAEATSEDLQLSHSLKDKSSSECSQPSDLVKDTAISLHDSARPSVMLLQPPHGFLTDDLQEPQELFQNVLDSQPPQDLLLSDLEPRTQDLLLHDMQPSHCQTFSTQPQEQGFLSPGREKDDPRNSLCFPVVDSFFAPLSQDLVSVGECPAECDGAVSSHLSASMEYSDMSYAAETQTTVASTAPKITQKLREKKKSK